MLRTATVREGRPTGSVGVMRSHVKLNLKMARTRRCTRRCTRKDFCSFLAGKLYLYPVQFGR